MISGVDGRRRVVIEVADPPNGTWEVTNTEDDHRRCLATAGFTDVTRREIAGLSRYLLLARA